MPSRRSLIHKRMHDVFGWILYGFDFCFFLSFFFSLCFHFASFLFYWITPFSRRGIHVNRVTTYLNFEFLEEPNKSRKISTFFAPMHFSVFRILTKYTFDVFLRTWRVNNRILQFYYKNSFCRVKIFAFL